MVVERLEISVEDCDLKFFTHPYSFFERTKKNRHGQNR